MPVDAGLPGLHSTRALGGWRVAWLQMAWLLCASAIQWS